MGNVVIVSSDSHAGMPPELWSEYLDARFHDLLPQLHADHAVYRTAMQIVSSRNMTRPETAEGHSTGGWRGLYDPQIRLAEMDRDGIAAELIYHGDFRHGDLFHNVTNRQYPLEAWEAGARAHNHWLHDTFGFDLERFLLVGAVGPCVAMDAALADLDWIADHGFVGTYAPGYLRRLDLPPLHHEFWTPYWDRAEQRGIAIVVHAGYGFEQGSVFPEIERIYNDAAEIVGSSEPEALLARPEALDRSFFGGSFFVDIRPRRPMLQMMLGGVFDRHPGLKLMLTEIRADWIPATLTHLDGIYEWNHSRLPAERTPSEYWRTNCLAGASFIHRSEVEMRDEIGVETISFGRDFPHPEGTWPHTGQWLRDAFAGVSEGDARRILGGNVIDFLALDASGLQAIADRIGPTVDELLRPTSDVPRDLVEHFEVRGGYLKPAERGAKLDQVDDLVRTDFTDVALD